MCWTRHHKHPLEFEVNMPAAPGLPALAIVKKEVPSCVRGRKRILEEVYWIEMAPAVWGCAYKLVKGWDGRDFADDAAEDNVHHVNLDPRRRVHSCDCRGFARYSYCKHVDVCIELFQLGFVKT